jgi:DNA-binding IclR family transcriptional regulator
MRTIIAGSRANDYVHTSLPFVTSFSSVAVPVRNVLGKVEAAMVVAIYEPGGKSDAALQEVLPQLRESAKQLSEILLDQAE